MLIVHYRVWAHSLKVRYMQSQFWADKVKNASCIIWCDNFAVVYCFSGHEIKDDFLSACVRTAWYVCGIDNVYLKVNTFVVRLTPMQTSCLVGIFIKNKATVEVKNFYNVNGYIQIVTLCYLSFLYRGLGLLELSISTASPLYSRSSRNEAVVGICRQKVAFRTSP